MRAKKRFVMSLCTMFLLFHSAGGNAQGSADPNKAPASIKTAPGIAAVIWATQLRGPRGLLFDSTGTLWVVEESGGALAKIGPSRQAVVVATGMHAPHDLEIDVKGNVYVAETGRRTTSTLPTQQGDTAMKFLILVKATKDSEAGVMPTEKLLTEMGKFNEELAKAGIILAGEGLHPSSKGTRVRFSGTNRMVVDGPFSETKELVAGFWLWQVKSREEAIEWVKRCPNPMLEDSEIEIRQVYEAEDFGAALTPELREQEERLRKQVAAKA